MDSKTQKAIDDAFDRTARSEQEFTAAWVDDIKRQMDGLPGRVELRLRALQGILLELATQGAPLDAVLDAGCIGGVLSFGKRGSTYSTPLDNRGWFSAAIEALIEEVRKRLDRGASNLNDGDYELVFYVRRAKPKEGA